MPKIVTQTALLQCDNGTVVTPLMVTSQSFCFLDEKLVATEQDKIPIVNIMPFGQCKLKPCQSGYLPCVPAPSVWKDTTKKNTLNQYKILLDSSTCPCSMGGTISVKDKGHQGNHEAE
ncbi:MAG: DUF4280 domain-containing protein [Flavobacteriaceae bacterium]|jgi:hypothetical protein|nr:DUF4280 domain-containing protein [Flavobacteriaceae bacterium]